MRPVSLSYGRLAAVTYLAVIAMAMSCSSGADETATPSSTATAVVAGPTPTPHPTAQPTPVVDNTATPSPTQQPAEPSPTAPLSTVTPTLTAPTSTATTPTTEVPDPEPSPTPVDTPTTPQSGSELVNEPLGVIQLRPGIGTAATYAPGVSAANFRVNVGFSNPFHPDFAPWNYGIRFRDDGQTFQMFVFDHRGSLNHIIGDRNELEVVRSVPVPNMVTNGGAKNDFTVVVIEDRAFVLMDQILIDIFDVPEPDRVGEVSLVTDIFNQTTVVGAVVEFFDLTINSAGLIRSSDSGSLVRQDAELPITGEASSLTSATYTLITFESPINAFSGDYSFGLLFNVEEKGIGNWLVFDDSREWRFIRRSTTGAQAVTARGEAALLGTAAGNLNFIEFLSTGDRHKIYLNGEFLADVTIPPDDKPFTVAPSAAFEPSHQTGGIATKYSDFVVWSIAE